MKAAIKQYIIPILSFLLILSNFSYAADIMICGMMTDGKVKSCCVRNSDNAQSAVRLSNLKKSCCDSRTIELSNSANLLNIKNDLSTIDILAQSVLGSNLIDLPNNLSVDLSTNQKTPRDIPILTSSLLI